VNVESGRLSHAYIASGEMAETLAMAAVCSAFGAERPCRLCVHCGKASRRVHPDITFIDKLPDKREIIVDQIRGLKEDVIVIPCESDKKAYLIYNADSMNRNAQNALLQVLEEPPAHAVFILKTESPAELLPTVRSRCVEIKAKAAEAAAGGEAETSAAVAEAADGFFSALESGNVGLAAFMFKLEKLDKETLAEFLAAVRSRTAAGLKAYAPGHPGVPRKTLAHLDRVLARAEEMLGLNVNAGHISGLICASLLEI